MYSNFFEKTGIVRADITWDPSSSARNIYSSLFMDCDKLEYVSDVRVETQVGESHCAAMFRGCTSLVHGPKINNGLISNTLSYGVFNSMFEGCTNLVDIPDFTVTSSLVGYGQFVGMFRGCSSLKIAPTINFAGDMSVAMFAEMFKGCASLITPPVLPSLNITESCYHSMFEGCVSLKQTPVLPAATLAKNCYSAMFKGCTSLETAPDLPSYGASTSTECYYQMFYNCISLTSAKIASEYGAYCNEMFYNVTYPGSLHVPSSITSWPGKPTNWSLVQDYNP